MTYQQKVRAQMPLCGTHINLADITVSEIFGALGYDYLWVDMEHTELYPADVHRHIVAARNAGTPVIVRVPVHDLTTTKKVLEIGPDGIVFPMVESYDDARTLLSWSLYPPYGARGCGPKAAIRYGLDDEPAFYAAGHLDMCRFVQIETRGAVEDAERIAALPHLDGCVLGMFDLSGSIGRPGDIFCRENLAQAERAVRAFRDAGKTVGISTFAADDATLRRYRDMGVNMLTAGADYDYILRSGRDTIARMRAVQDEG